MDYRDRKKYYNLNYYNVLLSKDYKEKFREKWFREEEEIKIIQKKSRRRFTIKKNMEDKCLNWYGTLTVNRNWKDASDLKKLQASIQKLLKYYKIDYYLVPELHSDNVNYHFHGFFGIRDLCVVESQNKKDAFGNNLYSLIPYSKNYGFSSLINIEIKDEYQRNKLVNYLVKYMIKDNIRAMSSRKNYYHDYVIDKTVELFGDLVIIN